MADQFDTRVLEAGASLTDALGSFQNTVVALNGIRQVLAQMVPSLTSGQMAASTLVQSGFVRVLGIAVSTAGAAGALHDAPTLAGAASGNVIFTVPATIGFYPTNMVFKDGLVYVPGASQVAAVFYARA